MGAEHAAIQRWEETLSTCAGAWRVKRCHHAALLNLLQVFAAAEPLTLRSEATSIAFSILRYTCEDGLSGTSRAICCNVQQLFQTGVNHRVCMKRRYASSLILLLHHVADVIYWPLVNPDDVRAPKAWAVSIHQVHTITVFTIDTWWNWLKNTEATCTQSWSWWWCNSHQECVTA